MTPRRLWPWQHLGDVALGLVANRQPAPHLRHPLAAAPATPAHDAAAPSTPAPHILALGAAVRIALAQERAAGRSPQRVSRLLARELGATIAVARAESTRQSLLLRYGHLIDEAAGRTPRGDRAAAGVLREVRP